MVVISIIEIYDKFHGENIAVEIFLTEEQFEMTSVHSKETKTRLL